MAAGPRGGREWAVRALLVLGAALILTSLRYPFWSMRVYAPQYPKGLGLTVYADRLTGDVSEIDNLNHYIGMRPLAKGAVIERKLAVPAFAAAGFALLVAAALRRSWTLLLLLPAMALPLVFAADLYWWLRDFGLNLDPHAPLNRSIKPFVPTLLGEGRIGQFRSVAWFAHGYYQCVAAAVLAFAAGWLRRRGGLACPLRRAPAVLGAACLLFAGPADAAVRIIEPGASLAQAVAEAAPGDTLIVRGGRHGPLAVEKPLTLIGEESPVIDGGGRGTVVRLAAAGTVFRGFTIRGSGDVLAAGDAGILISAPEITVEACRLEDVLFGISARRAPRSRLLGNTVGGKALPIARRGDAIRIWSSDRVLVEGNTVSDARDVVFWYSSGLRLLGNRVRRGRYGFHFMYCDGAEVRGNELRDNSVGAYLMYSRGLRLEGNRLIHNRGPSGYGLGLKDMSGTVVAGNVMADNRGGIFLEHATAEFAGNVIAYNDTGALVMASAQGNRFSGNSFIENGEQARIAPGPASTNEWRGNFWSDYRGYDADRDGTGDQAYEAVELFERLTDRYPALRLYAGSPAAEALELAGRLFPVFAPRPMLRDAVPLIRHPSGGPGR